MKTPLKWVMPARTDRPNSPLADIAYAYHFDAGLYARYLRGLCEQRGVRRTEGKITQVLQREGCVLPGVAADGRVRWRWLGKA